MLSEDKINEIALKIKNKINPDKIYLFGSYAYGLPKENSDIDLLVIKDGIENKRKYLTQLKKDLISKDYSLDILLYSNEEYLNNKLSGWRIFEEIEKTGKILNV